MARIGLSGSLRCERARAKSKFAPFGGSGCPRRHRPRYCGLPLFHSSPAPTQLRAICRELRSGIDISRLVFGITRPPRSHDKNPLPGIWARGQPEIIVRASDRSSPVALRGVPIEGRSWFLFGSPVTRATPMAKKDEIALMAHFMRRAGFSANRDEPRGARAKSYAAVAEELLHPETQPPVDPCTLLRHQPSPLLPGGVPPMGNAWPTSGRYPSHSQHFRESATTESGFLPICLPLVAVEIPVPFRRRCTRVTEEQPWPKDTTS